MLNVIEFAMSEIKVANVSSKLYDKGGASLSSPLASMQVPFPTQ